MQRWRASTRDVLDACLVAVFRVGSVGTPDSPERRVEVSRIPARRASEGILPRLRVGLVSSGGLPMNMMALLSHCALSQVIGESAEGIMRTLSDRFSDRRHQLIDMLHRA